MIKNSDLHLLLQCDVSIVQEKERILINKFKIEFKSHSDGTEYFIGDPNKMKQIIYKELFIHSST